jgi:hypothetical protein
MPKLAVEAAFARRAWCASTARSLELYIVARDLGVGYTTLIGHLERTLRFLSSSTANALRKSKLPQLRSRLAGFDITYDLVLADRHWGARPLDLEVGDIALLEPTAALDGQCAIYRRRPVPYVLATAPGTGTIAQSGRQPIEIRVSRRGFTGLARYSHLEDPGLMTAEHYVEEGNLSKAWAQALRLASARGRSEVAPLVLAITGFDDSGNFEEELNIRGALDRVLSESGKQSVDTVANTIFPKSLWNIHADRQILFDRYLRILPKIRKASRKNSRGTYFERIITGGAAGRENQLEFAIGIYVGRAGVRRSVLQIAVFDPSRDHSGAAQLGFPCLQHVTFVPAEEGLCVNAFYATQYLVERAYGNYVGLCRLGQFVAHEMGLRLARLTCFTGIAECEMSKSKIAIVLDAMENDLGTRLEDVRNDGSR